MNEIVGLLRRHATVRKFTDNLKAKGLL